MHLDAWRELLSSLWMYGGRVPIGRHGRDLVCLIGACALVADMFYNATAFNQPLGFDTSSVTSMEGVHQ